MGTIQDNKYRELISLGYTGALPDMFKRYLEDNGFGSFNDYINYLYSLGYTGAVPDIESEFWSISYWLDELGDTWDNETSGFWVKE